MENTSLAEFDRQLLDGLYFCSRVYTLFESVRKSPGGVSRLRRRTTKTEKRLLEELLPIAKYVQSSYRLGRYIAVRWIDGSQQYDAELVQEGSYVCENYYPATAFLEVTNAVHPKEHMNRELLDKKGSAFGLEGIRRLKSGELVSEPVGYSNRDFVEKFSHIVLKELNKKSVKTYPENTTLIVQATLNLPYMPDEWQDLIDRVQAQLPCSSFREIFMYDPLGHHSHTFYPTKKNDTSQETPSK
jgi:hypothetical protein